MTASSRRGQIWEAALFAPHHELENLVLIIDDNGQQIDGPTKEVLRLGSFADKYRAFGWDIMQMDGNNMEETVNTLKKAQAKRNGKPTCIVMKTEMGMGVDFMVGTHHWHGKAPNKEQAENALSQLEETLGDFPADGILIGGLVRWCVLRGCSLRSFGTLGLEALDLGAPCNAPTHQPCNAPTLQGSDLFPKNIINVNFRQTTIYRQEGHP